MVQLPFGHTTKVVWGGRNAVGWLGKVGGGQAAQWLVSVHNRLVEKGLVELNSQATKL